MKTLATLYGHFLHGLGFAAGWAALNAIVGLAIWLLGNLKN